MTATESGTETASQQAKGAVRDADQSRTLDVAVRVGLVAYGAVHLLVALLALQLAFGTDSGGEASAGGALHQVAQQPLGKGLLIVVGAALGALVFWRLIQAARAYTETDGGKRVVKMGGYLFKAAIYGFLGVTAVRIALGSSSGGGGEETMTAKVMAVGGGRILIGALGFAVIAYGVFVLSKAVTKSFKDQLTANGKSGDLGTATVVIGQAGHAGKGTSIALVGGLFVWAAAAYDAEKAGGLDAALHTLLGQPYGKVMLIVVALGIGCYGVYCLVRARHTSR